MRHSTTTRDCQRRRKLKVRKMRWEQPRGGSYASSSVGCVMQWIFVISVRSNAVRIVMVPMWFEFTEDLRGEMMVPAAKKLEDLIHLAELCVDLLQQNEEHYAEVRKNCLHFIFVMLIITCPLLSTFLPLLLFYSYILTFNMWFFRTIIHQMSSTNIVKILFTRELRRECWHKKQKLFISSAAFNWISWISSRIKMFITHAPPRLSIRLTVRVSFVIAWITQLRTSVLEDSAVAKLNEKRRARSVAFTKQLIFFFSIIGTSRAFIHFNRSLSGSLIHATCYTASLSQRSSSGVIYEHKLSHPDFFGFLSSCSILFYVVLFSLCVFLLACLRLYMSAQRWRQSGGKFSCRCSIS